MFALPDAWVWDFWVVDDGERYHLFFLFASKALKDPEARHHRASIGHAVSDDLVHWERVVDALVRADAPAFDDLATWTGSIVRHPDGSWRLFYTGATMSPLGNVQSIGIAASDDLLDWRRVAGPVLAADPRWYERLQDLAEGETSWGDEAFRDPWVYPDPAGGWRMLITARARSGPMDDRGVIATAVSPDLEHWTLQPPLTPPGLGFGQLEVMETVVLEGRPFLMFNCLRAQLSAAHRATGTTGGVWITPTHEGDRPWDPSEAVLLAGSDRYVGRIVAERGTGRMHFLAFRNEGPDGRFVGGITDPVPVGLDADGVPRLLG